MPVVLPLGRFDASGNRPVGGFAQPTAAGHFANQIGATDWCTRQEDRESSAA